MADFVAVLRKTIGNLGENTPEMREKVYEKARATISAKLAALNPQPPQAVIDRQLQALEDAVKVVRAEYEPQDVAEDDGLEDIFSSMVDADPEPARDPGLDDTSRSGRDDIVAPVPPKAAGHRYGEDPRFPDRDDIVEVEADAPASHDDLPISEPRGEQRRNPAAQAVPVRSGKRGKGARTGLIAALLAFVVIAGAGYAVWINRDDFANMFGGASTVETASEPSDLEADAPATDELANVEPPAEDAAAAVDNPPAEAAPGPEGPEPKFTQRLLPDGSEIDDGPAGDPARIGEGSSIASAAQNGVDGEQAPAATGTDDQAGSEDNAVGPIAIGQRAIFYEERTSTTQGSAETGSIVWSLVRESPGGDLPPEPAIRAEATIPDSDLQLRMTIRRNGDETLPASHIIEMIFLTPEGFGGGGINSVTRIAFKETEQSPGNPLLGIPARIADGFFLVALSDTPAESEANLALMRRQSWIDIPLVYQSGRRALITLEKGTPGDRVFDEALGAWAQDPAGAGNAEADDAG